MQYTFSKPKAWVRNSLFALMIIAMTWLSCSKTDISTPNDDPTNRKTEGPLGKSVLNCIVDTMLFGSEIQGNQAYLYVHDVDNDSTMRIEIDYHTHPGCTGRVDSESLANDSTTLAWTSWFRDGDSTLLDLQNLNQRQITLIPDSAWESVYMLGVKQVNATITPKTFIRYWTSSKFQSKWMLQTDTGSHRLAVEQINNTFLNDLSQPEIDQWFGNHQVASTDCWVYILRHP